MSQQYVNLMGISEALMRLERTYRLDVLLKLAKVGRHDIHHGGEIQKFSANLIHQELKWMNEKKSLEREENKEEIIDDELFYG